MTNPFNSGPIAAQRNPPINPQYYSPDFSVIASVIPVSTFQTTFTTSEENEFVVGQLVRFIIPSGCGMGRLNEQVAYIVSIADSTTFNASVNTSGLDAFNPSGNPNQTPMIIPVGDVNNGQINTQGRTNNGLDIPGSFINLSPR